LLNLTFGIKLIVEWLAVGSVVVWFKELFEENRCSRVRLSGVINV